jgi:hypothetical protein
MTTTTEIITFLREFNRWRRGDDSIPQPQPGMASKMIDAACDHLADLEQRFREKCMKETRLQCQLDERWGMRRELEAALGVTAGMENDESLRVGLEAIKQLQNERDEYKHALLNQPILTDQQKGGTRVK